MLALVAAGVGAAFVPAGAARVAPRPVVVTPIDHPGAEWEVAVVWNRDRPHPMTAHFLGLVRKTA
ncbi:LysR substrate-binding domain-containing protein [Nonomuraea sp. NPDC050786]|uniref:LysR substrate-binding domain-containing protein n=1 Tax=Nonomuraea sp. NPDC050786 TaxID=3154840 RepID=UPI0033E19DDE